MHDAAFLGGKAAGQSHAQVWLKLAELLCKHPREVAAGGTALDTEAIVRAGIARQEDALAHSAPDEASRPAFAPPPQTQPPQQWQHSGCGHICWLLCVLSLLKQHKHSE